MALSKITTASLSDNAVTTAKITDANITTAKIADANVTTAKVADDGITNAKIGAGAVTNTEVNASASIAKTKLASLDIVNADVNASAGIVATKLGTMATANMPSGSIIQTVYNNFCSADTTSGTSLTNTGLSVNITPLFQNSVFIVNTSQNFYITEEPGTDAQGQFVIQRTISGTDSKIKEVVVGDHTGSGNRSTTWDELDFVVYDTPNTTSQLTYRTQYKVYNSSYTAGVQTSSQCSHITVYEIKQ